MSKGDKEMWMVLYGVMLLVLAWLAYAVVCEILWHVEHEWWPQLKNWLKR